MNFNYELILQGSPTRETLPERILRTLHNTLQTLWKTLCISCQYFVKNQGKLWGYIAKILWKPLSISQLRLLLILIPLLLLSTRSDSVSRFSPPPSHLIFERISGLRSLDSVSLPLRRYAASNARVRLREGSVAHKIPLTIKQGEQTSKILQQQLAPASPPSPASINSAVWEELDAFAARGSPSRGARRFVLSVLGDEASSSFSLTEEYRRRLVATKQNSEWQVETQSFPVHIEYDLIAAPIERNFYLTAQEKKISASLFRKFLDVMSFDVDFQRDIWRGASFRLLTRKEVSATGTILSGPVIVAASLYTGRREFTYFRAEHNGAFYDAEGNSARRSLRRTPIGGLRVSSRYGKRRHPILGFTRMHKGVDFAAPYGTAVLAAGEGVIQKVARNRSYGRYIVLRHNARLSTLYAHLRSFKRGVRRGVRVAQGQTIGYTGSSGFSTGPHLHYEIHRDGRAVNPRRVRLPTLPPLESRYVAEFQSLRLSHARLLAGESLPRAPSAVTRLSRLGCSALAVVGLCENSLQDGKEASIVTSL